MTSPKIVGLDLSLTSTGVAVVQAGVVSTHRIQPPGPAKMSRQARLRELYRGIRPLAWGATHITVEGPAYGAPQGMHLLGGVWWMVMHVMWLDNPDAEVVVVTPHLLKKYALGTSKAEKDEILAAVILRYGVPVRGNDESDALVLAAMTADQLGQPLATVPQVNREALKYWPYADGKKNASKGK